MSTTTIYLHGFSGDSSSLDEFVETVGYEKSVAVDLPAFGKNRRTYQPSWDGYILAAMKTIADEAGVGPYRIIGHSHGAMVAFGLAEQFPDQVKEIVLICPVASGTNLGRAFMRANSVMRKILGDTRTLSIHKMKLMVDTVTRISRQNDWPPEAYERIKSMRRNESARYDANMLDVLKLIPSFRARYEQTRLDLPVGLIFAHNDFLVSESDRTWYKQHVQKPHVEWCRGGHVAPVVFPAEVAARIHRTLEDLVV